MKNYTFIKTALLAFFATTLLISCSNSTGSDEHEQEPVGLRVKTFENNVTGSTVLEIQNGMVSDSIFVTHSNTNQYKVVFLDEDGEEFLPDIEEHTVDFTITEGETVATALIPFSGVEPFTFQIRGDELGEASLIIDLKHEGSTEFLSPKITIKVVANQ